MELANKMNCTGCGLCREVCPGGAISMEEDLKDGFRYPMIDSSRCIECGLCTHSCPEIATHYTREDYDVQAYAANAKDLSIRKGSASGGMFWLLARHVLKIGGSVVGVKYGEGLNAYHVLIDRQDELPELVRSKYMQSDMTKVYGTMEQRLKTGKMVLFCGTPCQVSAVRQLFSQKQLDGKLILVDLICRGVPSPKAFHAYASQIELEQGKKLSSVIFKDKEQGWHNRGVRFCFEDGSSIVEGWRQSEFLQSFIFENLCVRRSCFSCQYKREDRISDITIGDFWAKEEIPLLDNIGTSSVLINTKKGKELFQVLIDENQVDFIETTAQTVAGGSPAAYGGLKEYFGQRDLFWNLLETCDYRTAYRKVKEDEI